MKGMRERECKGQRQMTGVAHIVIASFLHMLDDFQAQGDYVWVASALWLMAMLVTLGIMEGCGLWPVLAWLSGVSCSGLRIALFLPMRILKVGDVFEEIESFLTCPESKFFMRSSQGWDNLPREVFWCRRSLLMCIPILNFSLWQ